MRGLVILFILVKVYILTCNNNELFNANNENEQ